MVKTKKQFLRIFAIIIIWSGLLAFVELVWQFAVLKKNFIGQVSVIVGQKNHFTAFMTMVVPLGLSYSLLTLKLSKRIFFFLLAIIASIAVFLSSSDAGIASLVLALLLFVFLLLNNRLLKITRWRLISFSVVGAIILFILGVNGYFYNLYSQLGGRINPAKDSLKISKDFFLFGVGGGNFHYIFPLYRTFESPFYNYLHNEFLQLIVEKGIIASCFYFLFFIFIFKEIITKIKKRNDLFVKVLSIGVLSGLFGVMVHSLFEFNFHVPAIEVRFWILLALVYKYSSTHFYKKKKIK